MDCVLCKINTGMIPSKGIVKKYSFWTLMISREQHTLCTLVLFLHRHTVRFSSINLQELKEFHQIQKDTEFAVDNLFSPELYNYLQCGNSVNHLHVHIIPRYKETKEFLQKKYSDEHYGNTVKETTNIEEESIIIALRDTINKRLPQLS